MAPGHLGVSVFAVVGRPPGAVTLGQFLKTARAWLASGVEGALGRARFYADVFGFQLFEHIAERRYDEIVMLHPPSGTIMCLQQHRANRGESAGRTIRRELDYRVPIQLAGMGWGASPELASTVAGAGGSERRVDLADH